MLLFWPVLEILFWKTCTLVAQPVVRGCLPAGLDADTGVVEADYPLWYGAGLRRGLVVVLRVTLLA